MNIEKGYIYHIYNQGNNRQQIFFEHENYIFFLKKLRTTLEPYADVLAWCLMPNHFHLMVYIKENIIAEQEMPANNTDKNNPALFNNAFGIMLRAYTRAINNRYKRSGSLFRSKTKAECVNCPSGVTPSFISKNGITQINITVPEKQYPQVCFDYIHANPVKAGLVKNITDWEFSSAPDYYGNRKGTFISKGKAMEYLNL